MPRIGRLSRRAPFYLWSRIGAGLAVVVGVGGCMVGPNYRPPQVPVPKSFTSGPATQPAEPGPTTRPAVDLARWWASLDDPVLETLIRRAVEGNIDLSIALARVEEARYVRTVVASGLWPLVSVASGGPGRPPLYGRASATLERIHTKTEPGGGLQLRQAATGTGLPGLPSLYATSPGRHPLSVLLSPGGAGTPASANIRPSLYNPEGKKRILDRDQFTYEGVAEVAWELDVFGGIRRAIEASNADIQAAVEARNDFLLMLVAETASAYVDLRGYQRRLEIAKINIGIQRHSVELVQTRLRDGLTSDLDLALAERQLASTESRVPALEAAIEQAQHRLSVLLGVPPEELLPELADTGRLAQPPPTVPVGLPSDLLAQRPDIRRAEREVAAATARIGVATAALYPQFTLTGSFGMQTSDVRHLLDANSLIWSAGPGIRWPIFEAGRLTGNVHVEETRAREALLNYRAVLLMALQEVEDALSSYNGQRSRYLKLLQAVDASTRALKLAEDRYDKGLTDFLNVLDAQRALYGLQDEAAASHQELMTALVNVYRALGRGWESWAGSAASTQPAM